MSNYPNWHILVVEDEPDGQEVVSALLADFGISSDQALSAEDGLVLLGQRQYTAAVIDLALPGTNGWGLLQIIRQTPELANMPCVAMTAFHTSQVRQQAAHAGFDGYFPKPLDDMSFVRELREIILKQI